MLNAPDNDALINKLHLGSLICKKENINKQTLPNNYKHNEVKSDYLFHDKSLKKIFLKIDESHFNFRKYDKYSNEANYSIIPKEGFKPVLSPENLLLQESAQNPAFKFKLNKQNLVMQERVSNALAKHILIENLDLKDLFVCNEAINKKKLFRDASYIMLENEDSFFEKSFLNFPNEKDLNNFSKIKECETNIDNTKFNYLSFHKLDLSQIDNIRLDYFLYSKTSFFPKRSFELTKLKAFEEKMPLQKKDIKKEDSILKSKEIPDKPNLCSDLDKTNIIIKNLHLDDLIANNNIINKSKLLKVNDCKNNKKEKALSYVNDLLTKPPLELNNLIEEVLKNNPDLSATKRRIEANALVVPRVQILDDPQFTVMRHDSPLKSNSPFFTKVRYEASQLFPFFGKLRLKGKIAEQMLKFAQNEEETTMRELVLQTKKLYYQLYLNYAALRINKQNQEIISRFIEDTLVLYKTGVEKYDEVLKAQVELQRLKKELLNLLSDHDFIVSMINEI